MGTYSALMEAIRQRAEKLDKQGLLEDVFEVPTLEEGHNEELERINRNLDVQKKTRIKKSVPRQKR